MVSCAYRAAAVPELFEKDWFLTSSLFATEVPAM
jgi:hypothetical protein